MGKAFKGKKAQEPQFVQPPPPQIIQAPIQPLPPQTIQQNASGLLQAQLGANPQLAQSAYDIQAKYAPLYQALYGQMFPQQTQGLETLAGQANQRLTSPQGLTPEQQSAQDALRQRQTDYLLRNIREGANLGGTLYGGRRQDAESQALQQLAQGFSAQDIGLQQQQRQQAVNEFQLAHGLGQVPSVSQFGQPVVPGPDMLMQALLQRMLVQQPVYQPGNPGTPGYFQSTLRGFGGQPGSFY